MPRGGSPQAGGGAAQLRGVGGGRPSDASQRWRGGAGPKALSPFRRGGAASSPPRKGYNLARLPPPSQSAPQRMTSPRFDAMPSMPNHEAPTLAPGTAAGYAAQASQFIAMTQVAPDASPDAVSPDSGSDPGMSQGEELLQRARVLEAALKQAQAAEIEPDLGLGLESHTDAPQSSAWPNVIGAADGSAVVEHIESVPRPDGNIVSAGYEATADAQSEASLYAATTHHARRMRARVFRVLVRELARERAQRLAWERRKQAALPPTPDQMGGAALNPWDQDNVQEQPQWMGSWSSVETAVEQRLQQQRHTGDQKNTPQSTRARACCSRTTPVAVSPDSISDPEISPETEPTAMQAEATDSGSDPEVSQGEELLQRARVLEAALKQAQATEIEPDLGLGLESHTDAPQSSDQPNVVGVWEAEGRLADGSAVVEHFELVLHPNGSIVGAGYEATADAQSGPSRFANVSVEAIPDGRWKIAMAQVFDNNDRTNWTAELLWNVDEGWTMVGGQWTSPAPAKKPIGMHGRAASVRELSHQPWTSNGELTHGNPNTPSQLGRRWLLTSSSTTYSPPSARTPWTARSPTAAAASRMPDSTTNSQNNSFVGGTEVQGSFAAAKLSAELAELVHERLEHVVEQVLRSPPKRPSRKRTTTGARSTLADSSRNNRTDQRSRAILTGEADGNLLLEQETPSEASRRDTKTRTHRTGSFTTSKCPTAQIKARTPGRNPSKASDRDTQVIEHRLGVSATSRSPNAQIIDGSRTPGRRQHGELAKKLENQQKIATRRALIKKKEAEHHRQLAKKAKKRKDKKPGSSTASPVISDFSSAQQAFMGHVSPAYASEQLSFSLRSPGPGRTHFNAMDEVENLTKKLESQLMLLQGRPQPADTGTDEKDRTELATDEAERVHLHDQAVHEKAIEMQEEKEKQWEDAEGAGRAAAGWTTMLSCNTGEIYYVNTITGVSTYDPSGNTIAAIESAGVVDKNHVAQSAEKLQLKPADTVIDEQEQQQHLLVVPSLDEKPCSKASSPSIDSCVDAPSPFAPLPIANHQRRARRPTSATQQAAKQRQAVREMANREVEQAEQQREQREEAERAAAARALPAEQDSNGEDLESSSSTSEISELGAIAATVSAQICNTAAVRAVTTAGANATTAAGSEHVVTKSIQSSPPLPPDNGTGYSPQHSPMRAFSPHQSPVTPTAG